MKNTILIILLSIFLYSCDEEVYTTISTSESHPCYVGEIEVKSGAAIQTFESPYVIDESQCKSQIRKCENGFLEPGSSFFFCQVIENFVSVDSGQFQYITTSNAGVDFSTLIFNDPLTEINNSAYLFLASAQKNNIRIYWPDGNTDNISVDGNSVTTIPVDEKFKIINSSVIEADKVISLDSDNPITVYGLNRAPNQTDAYVGIPTENLGTEYYIGTFASQYGSQVIIAASEDNTTVNVFPVSFIDNKTIVLDAGESIMYETIGSQDLTGTKIVANKKIGVYGGSTWSEVPYSNIGTGDVLLDQMLPTDSWKKLFLTYPLAGRNGGDTVRIIAKDDNTSIFQNDVLLAVIQDQEYVEILGLKDPAKFSSNNNIMVVQYQNTLAYDNSNNGDPFIMVVPGVEQYLNSYLFTVPSLSFAEDYANIIIHRDSIESTRFDGVSVNQNLFHEITGTDYFGATLILAEGSHIINSDMPFGLFVYGTNGVESYGYPGGFNLE